jgi:MFS transporter, MHS family, citrate/tricarballylate:H+ symporter
LSAAPPSARRAVLATTVGNGLEFYDFVTFAFFAIQIGETFFPSGDPFVSLMGSLATFGIGFLARPLGAWVLGGYADRHGRKPAMLISMVLMGVGIALLALTPGYATIGVAAPIIAVLARLIQGFALGGEVGSATTYMLEAVPPHRRGLAASLQAVSQGVAIALGSGVAFALSLLLGPEALAAWGWRIALLLGTVIVPFALLLRRSLPDTVDNGEAAEPPPSGNRGRIAGLGLMMIGAGTIATYLFNYMATFGQNTLKLPASSAMAGQFANSLVQVAAMLIGGWASDRLGRRPMMIIPQLAFLALVVPCFYWIVSTRATHAFILSNMVLAACCFMSMAPAFAAISESLPRQSRARGFALIYALPVTFLGGTTQLVVTWLLKVTGDPMAIAWYLAAVSATGLAAMMLMQETAPVRRRLAAA